MGHRASLKQINQQALSHQRVTLRILAISHCKLSLIRQCLLLHSVGLKFISRDLTLTIGNYYRSGKRRRPRDEAYFGYCTVEDFETLGSGKATK